ncbi:HAD family hydrolase [Draconibacterium halophilum]|uniref:Haloacid dehalogenase-like hydrolase n=1 Tax=Draconibacterium halophilum TaxID=2706887 RepID=A0A6C0R9N9_9BACT|nr:HAD family hydrolase [Draconibacterium halophilum]QIA06405.1 haloacid dehalogenase-like hydrolase [Draconibacterium halophilum]
MMHRNLFLLLALLLTQCTITTKESSKTEVLPLWNDGAVKTAITEFVSNVTDTTSADFVAVTDRIAVFDNDGTLWCEKPVCIPVELELAYVKREYPKRPEWEQNKFFSGLAGDNLSVLEDYSTEEIINKIFDAQQGMKEEDYKDFVYKTLSQVKHRKFNRPLKEMTYSPMVQLVHYLQNNNFSVYIVTGGEITSVRTISEEIYDIPKENVVGTSVLLEYVSDENGAYLVRTAEMNSNNNKAVKPTNIELHIGRKPIFAAGNSDGDYQMMEYTLSGDKPSMAILVHHNDEAREFDYMHGSEMAIADAAEKGWHVVSMKDDFKEIFAE